MRSGMALAVLMLWLSARIVAAGLPPRVDGFLGIRSATAPSAGPDGREIAFVTDLTGTDQAYRVGTGPNHPDPLRRLTGDYGRVTFVRWAPDGHSLVFGRDLQGSGRIQLYRCNRRGSEFRRLTADDGAVHRFGAFSDDGSLIAYSSNERNLAFFDVYVLRTATLRAERVLQNDGLWEAVCFSPDHAHLVVRQTLGRWNQNLYLLDLVNGEKKLLTPHHGDARYERVCWPVGSDTLWLTTDQGASLRRIARLDLATRRLEGMGDGRHDVTDLAVSRTGRYVAWIENVDGYSRLHLGALYQGPLLAPTVGDLPEGVYSGVSFSRDERILAMACSGPRHPSEVWAVASFGGTPWQVTHSDPGGVDASRLVAPTAVRYPSFDGRRVPALLYLPMTGGGRHPVVIAVDGGGDRPVRPCFSALYQYLLASGYGVLAPAIRGSAGYGQAYARLADGRRREDALNDVDAAVKYLRGRPDVDGGRIAVMGGYTALAAMALFPDDFAGVVDLGGVSDLETFLKGGASWSRDLRVEEYGNPLTDRDFLERLSPLQHVDALTAPVLVIHGRQDARVPVSESDQLVKALQIRGRPVQYVLLDDEGHRITLFKDRLAVCSAVGDFLARTLRP